MSLLAVLLLGIGLSLDTFAVSLTLGLAAGRTTYRQKARFLAVIGLFHFAMILAGWFMGETVSRLIAAYDHWIAFGLLAFIGGKMIRDGWRPEENSLSQGDLLSLRNTLLLGVALSLDALIVGFSFGLVKVALFDGSQAGNVSLAAAIVGLSAFAISAAGIVLGRKASSKLGGKAEIFGGIILIAIGIRTLVEHLSEWAG
ncbi:manganese efflux pump MntP family protein [uncultured Alistipes sp.]|uniref:manganese efflux pump MntP n=1 Tax=uncultured Alistipes sp. TaxID=538949 RepID=UPI0026028A12|nr:manganese efflux pump MntP family protein [uncultured Alistipes sp.]